MTPTPEPAPGVQWSELTAIIALIFTAGGIVATAVWRLWSRSAAETKDRQKTMDDLRKEQAEALASLRREHAAELSKLRDDQRTFEVRVAEDYATTNALIRVEASLSQAIDRMAEQLKDHFATIVDLIKQ